MKINYSSLYLLLLAVVISCGKISPKGDIMSKDIPVEEFSNLDLKGNYRVFFVSGEENFVSIETYKNIADNLNIKVTDNMLSISEKNETERVDFYNITIYSKRKVEKIELQDSLEFNVSGGIKSEHLQLNLKNNAKFIGAVNTEKITVKMTDLSRANFLGKTKNATLKIADTANVIAPYWRVNVLNIEAQNGNYTEVNVLDTLKGNLQNTSKMVLYGKPVEVFKIDKNVQVERK